MGVMRGLSHAFAAPPVAVELVARKPDEGAARRVALTEKGHWELRIDVEATSERSNLVVRRANLV
jgi:hypothetical protein